MKNIKNVGKYLIAIAFVLLALQSCGTMASLVNDPYIQEGFRIGWNSTAPEEYRY